ncbi:MAG TPA: GNAT family N-acetyltransferase [Patescibacteria group bacterium]|nr:GNAT family N-acetyltransferase [Patescibacteria group bacterium]
MPPSRGADSVRPFEPSDLDAAARLLAGRHRRHRLAEPLLDPAYEDPGAARREIEALLRGDRAAGWVTVRDGGVVAYLIGIAKTEAIWGPNVWVEAAGHAAEDPTLVRDLYAVAAGAWVGEGRTNHHVLVPASDAALVEAWFSLDFGQQHLHAVVEAPPASFGVVPRSELIIRAATLDDVPPLVELGRVLPLHLRLSPVFSRVPAETDEEVEAEVRADLVDPTYQFFVAEHVGKVIGVSLACSLEVSSGSIGLSRPDHAGYLAHAAVLPEARGLGAGRALGDAVLSWSRDQGYRSIATDWRSTNTEADRAWRGMGFRPTFRRLHRLIG